MGRDKAFVEVEGRSMLDWVTAALSEATDRVVIAGRQGTLLGFNAVADPVDGPAGPLAGLASALGEAVKAGAVAAMVVAVDQPFVRAETLTHLVDEFRGQAVVPEADSVRQVTCALYPAAWIDEASVELAAGGSIQSLLGRMPHALVAPARWSAWGEDGRSWFSVDSPAAIDEGIQRYGSVLE